LIDVNREALERVRAELTSLGHPVLAIPVDVRDSSAIEAALDRIKRDFGPVGALVNNAGILRTGPIVSMHESDWADVFAVNVTGVFLVSRAVAKRMCRRRAGSIITIGSNAAAVPRMHMGAYAASKSAAAHFTKCLGLELAGHGIRCNVVSPGSTGMPMQRALWTGPDAPEKVISGDLESFRTGIPLKTIAVSDDIANAVYFLISDEASRITMQGLCIDGGASLGAHS
jgi:2,3-dihydro-2,3-dihydroxybenzoate dehydrogenase